MEDLPLARNCKVLQSHPAGIFILEKASGVLTHPNSSNKNSSNNTVHALLNAEYDHRGEFYTLKDGKKLFLTHRLDSPTSGLLAVTTRKELAEEIKKNFRLGKIKKTYFAIVFQKKQIPLGVWTDNLAVKDLNGKLRVFRDKAGLVSKTHCSIVQGPKKNFSLTMLKLVPFTGRTHQLRVQTSIRNAPIVGDKNYGDFKLNRSLLKSIKFNRLFLHASKLEFTVGELTLRASSTIPQQFGKLMDLD